MASPTAADPKEEPMDVEGAAGPVPPAPDPATPAMEAGELQEGGSGDEEMAVVVAIPAVAVEARSSPQPSVEEPPLEPYVDPGRGPGVDAIGSKGMRHMSDIYSRAPRLPPIAMAAEEEEPRTSAGPEVPQPLRQVQQEQQVQVVPPAAEAAVPTATVAAGPEEGEAIYTRRGPITMAELYVAFANAPAPPFPFVRMFGQVRAYFSRSVKVRPPLALAALRMNAVLPFDEWESEGASPVHVGPTVPFWDPRITSSMIASGLVIMIDEEKR